jgi:hypothetical protein
MIRYFLGLYTRGIYHPVMSSKRSRGRPRKVDDTCGGITSHDKPVPKLEPVFEPVTLPEPVMLPELVKLPEPVMLPELVKRFELPIESKEARCRRLAIAKHPMCEPLWYAHMYATKLRECIEKPDIVLPLELKRFSTVDKRLSAMAWLDMAIKKVDRCYGIHAEIRMSYCVAEDEPDSKQWSYDRVTTALEKWMQSYDK